MRLVKDNNPGAWAVRVLCIACNKSFTLAQGYADLDGTPFKSYYCAECAEKWR